MKKAISNILTGFWWPGRKTTTNNSENAQASDDSRDFDEIKINLDCDQISRIGKAGLRMTQKDHTERSLPG